MDVNEARICREQEQFDQNESEANNNETETENGRPSKLA